MKRFTRLTICFSRNLENLAAAFAMFIAYYNYCWRTPLPGKTGRLRPTAAMAAGLVGEMWSVEDLYRAVAG